MNTLTIIVCVNQKNEKIGYDFLNNEVKKIKFLNPKSKLILSLKSIEEYSNFCIKKLNSFFDTDFCLIEQLDGFILNPFAWNDIFFKYDYIGAPWSRFDQLNYKTNDKNCLVGNGGFSLRSKKLQTILASNLTNDYKNEPEDIYICQNKRNDLIANGINFAPYEIAKNFSVENNIYSGQFGFHKGFFNKGKYYKF